MQLLRAGDASQVLVERRLHACLADLVVRVVAGAEALQLRLRDRADVAENLCGEILVRIVAKEVAAGA